METCWPGRRWPEVCTRSCGDTGDQTPVIKVGSAGQTVQAPGDPRTQLPAFYLDPIFFSHLSLGPGL